MKSCEAVLPEETWRTLRLVKHALLVEGFSLFWIFLGRSIIRFHRRPNRNVVQTWRFPGIETPERRQVLSHCDAIVGVDVTIWSSVLTLRFDRRCRRYETESEKGFVQYYWRLTLDSWKSFYKHIGILYLNFCLF